MVLAVLVSVEVSVVTLPGRGWAMLRAGRGRRRVGRPGRVVSCVRVAGNRRDGTEPVRGGCFFLLGCWPERVVSSVLVGGRADSPLIHRLVRVDVLLVGSRVVDPGRSGFW
jgi:hypothetical protein